MAIPMKNVASRKAIGAARARRRGGGGARDRHSGSEKLCAIDRGSPFWLRLLFASQVTPTTINGRDSDYARPDYATAGRNDHARDVAAADPDGGAAPAPPVPVWPGPPLEVDTITSVWDVLGSLGGFIGGVGAAYALVIGAQTYRRESDEKRRQQAAKVVMQITGGVSQSAKDEPLQLELYNGSDQPIYDVRWVITVKDADRKVKGTYSRRAGAAYLGAFATLTVVPEGIQQDSLLSGSVGFKDATGKEWVRNATGGLHELGVPRRYGRETLLIPPDEDKAPKDATGAD